MISYSSASAISASARWPVTGCLSLARSLARRFADSLHDERNVGVPKHVAGRIDRSGERRGPDPPPKPTAKLSSAEPQRRPQEHLGKPLALAIIEPRPAFQSYRDQINAPHMRALKGPTLSKRKHKNKNPKYSQ